MHPRPPEPPVEAVPEQLAALPDHLKSRDLLERVEAGLAIVLGGVEGRVGD